MVLVLVSDPERQKDCEALLGPVSNEKMADLVSLGKLITDYVGEGEQMAGADAAGLDEDIGVAVEVSAALQSSTLVLGFDRSSEDFVLLSCHALWFWLCDVTVLERMDMLGIKCLTKVVVLGDLPASLVRMPLRDNRRLELMLQLWLRKKSVWQ